jgi:hypothetical protein
MRESHRVHELRRPAIGRRARSVAPRIAPPSSATIASCVCSRAQEFHGFNNQGGQLQGLRPPAIVPPLPEKLGALIRAGPGPGRTVGEPLGVLATPGQARRGAARARAARLAHSQKPGLAPRARSRSPLPSRRQTWARPAESPGTWAARSHYRSVWAGTPTPPRAHVSVRQHGFSATLPSCLHPAPGAAAGCSRRPACGWARRVGPGRFS